jgi:hypothetical protein
MRGNPALYLQEDTKAQSFLKCHSGRSEAQTRNYCREQISKAQIPDNPPSLSLRRDFRK